MTVRSPTLACLLGGAIGDALGAPIEFLSLDQIRARFGPAGITGYTQLDHGIARFTDDTQMTLFTAEGFLLALPNADPIPTVHRAYRAWLQTQSGRFDPSRKVLEGRLLALPEMWALRAPGNTCLSALRSGTIGSMSQPLNDSKGCGGIMRAAPAGLLFEPQVAFEMGCRLAALTHGHPTGYLSAGFFACLVSALLRGSDLPAAIRMAQLLLLGHTGREETAAAVQAALQLAADSSVTPSPEAVERLGGAWVGEEALAISLYCALVHPTDFRAAVLLSVNHSGDSDSTGAITGNLLGAALGMSAIPPEWIEPIELRAEIERLAVDIEKAASPR